MPLRRSHRYNSPAQQHVGFSQINVTPFVDVMLVLLIIFMITAPLLNVGVSVDLPDSDAPSLSQPDEPLVLTIQKDGALFFLDAKINPKQLVPLLLQASKGNKEVRIFIRADEALNYGHVLSVMGDVVGAGFGKVALVSDRRQQ